MRRVVLPLFLTMLMGCATRELELQQADAPWVAERAATVELPTFQADPTAWAVADTARSRLREALSKGTVRVVEQGGQLVLHGAVSAYLEQAIPGAPRRVLRSTGSTGPVLPGPFNETYAWEVDVEQAVQVRLVLRLQRPGGQVVWTKESAGAADESHAALVNWPGNDPMPPPATMPHAPDPNTYQRLRERALGEALEPLLAAVTMRYVYRELK